MSRSSTHRLDLDAYLARIGWSGSRHPDVATLRGAHRAHILGIPFENVAAVTGSAPSLDLPELEAKLVRSRRGGYCYEHNTFFAAALEALGFGVTLLTARVRVGADGAIRPRTHMMLLVDTPGAEQPYLADVGFGSPGGLLEAIPLVADAEHDDGARRHRLVIEPHRGPLPQWLLQRYEGEDWADQYAFTVEPYEHADYAIINWHTATNPRSPFQHTLRALRTLADGSYRRLIGRTLTEGTPDGTVKERELADRAEVLRVLATDFGIELPAGPELPV